MAIDYSEKSYIDPAQIAQLAQNQAAKQAQLTQQASQQKMQMIQQLAQSVSGMVSDSIQASKQKQQQDFLANSMAAKYAPNTMAAQQGPGLPAPTGQEQSLPPVNGQPQQGPGAQVMGEQSLPPVSTPDYIGQNAIKALVRQDPQKWSDLAAQMYNQTPLQQAQAQEATQKGALDAANMQKIQQPIQPATQSAIEAKHKAMNLPVIPGMFANTTELNGQAYLGKLNEGTKVDPNAPITLDDAYANDPDKIRLAQQLISGKGLPFTYTNSRGAEKEKLSMLAARIDPSWDPSVVPQRIAMRKAFVSGPDAQNLVASSTAINHIDLLKSKVAALGNADITSYNTLANYMAKNAGKPQVSGMVAAKNLVDGELAKVVSGSGQPTDALRKEFDDAFNSSSSPAQAAEVLDTYMGLMGGRVDTLRSKWKQTMGDQEPPTPFVSPAALKTLKKNGYDPETFQKVGAGSGKNDPLGIR